MKKMCKRIVYCWSLIKNKVVEYWWTNKRTSSASKGICLVFHHVCDDYFENIPNNCQCSVLEFRQMMNTLNINGFECINSSDLSKPSLPLRYAVITFDDVPIDFYQNAYPILKELNLPFTLFIASNFIGKTGYLNKDMIDCLVQDPLCTIAAHSCSHTMLRFCPLHTKTVEIVSARNLLESLFNVPISLFAFPYGSFYAVDNESRNIAKQTYELSFSTINVPLTEYSRTKTDFIPRIAVKDNLSLQITINKLKIVEK